MLQNKKSKPQVWCQRREERPLAARIDASWSVDFMCDGIFRRAQDPAINDSRKLFP